MLAAPEERMTAVGLLLASLVLVSCPAYTDVISREGQKYFVISWYKPYSEYGTTRWHDDRLGPLVDPTSKEFLLDNNAQLSSQAIDDLYQVVRRSYEASDTRYCAFLGSLWKQLSPVYQGDLYDDIILMIYKTHLNLLFGRLSDRGASGLYLFRTNYTESGKLRDYSKIYYDFFWEYLQSGTTSSQSAYSDSLDEFRKRQGRILDELYYLVAPRFTLRDSGELDAFLAIVVRKAYETFPANKDICAFFANKALTLVDHDAPRQDIVTFCSNNGITVTVPAVPSRKF